MTSWSKREILVCVTKCVNSSLFMILIMMIVLTLKDAVGGGGGGGGVCFVFCHCTHCDVNSIQTHSHKALIMCKTVNTSKAKLSC